MLLCLVTLAAGYACRGHSRNATGENADIWPPFTLVYRVREWTVEEQNGTRYPKEQDQVLKLTYGDQLHWKQEVLSDSTFPSEIGRWTEVVESRINRSDGPSSDNPQEPDGGLLWPTGDWFRPIESVQTLRTSGWQVVAASGELNLVKHYMRECTGEALYVECLGRSGVFDHTEEFRRDSHGIPTKYVNRVGDQLVETMEALSLEVGVR